MNGMDGAEIFGELIGGAIEGAANDKKGCGCLIVICFIAVLLVAACYYYESLPETKPSYINGKIIYKLDKDDVLLESKSGKKIYHIDHVLYINKNEGDSLCIMK